MAEHKHPSQLRPKPVVLMIIDGWGYSEESDNNAVRGAKSPNLNRLEMENPVAFLDASGEAVGLPDGQMGNSEAGHLNIGAGRVIYGELTRIDLAIKDGTFFNNCVLIDAVEHAKSSGGYLHLIGLLSDGGVHSHEQHLYALIKLAKENGLDRILIHAFLDGRDTPPRSAERYLVKLQKFLREIGVGEIATITGRFYGMDRDKRWERTKLAYDAITYGIGKSENNAIEAIHHAYDQDEDDEFVSPRVITPVIAKLKNARSAVKREIATGEDSLDKSAIKPDTSLIDQTDSVILFNFRPDRSRQLTCSFIEEDFKGFPRDVGFQAPYFVSLTRYKKEYDIPAAFMPQDTFPGLGELLAKKGLKQLRAAETEKYAHVTFFFSGGIEEPFPGEDRILVPSPGVETYDQKPEMSAYGIRDAVLNAIKVVDYDLVVINFANLDMVGHTGKYEATVMAMEAVDKCIGEIVQTVKDRGGVSLITADHGNAEQMVDPTTGQPHTSHGLSLVKFILVGCPGAELRQKGKLADIAPTILNIMGLDIPVFMTGNNLLKAGSYNTIAT